jgi:hypothetical protein
VSNLLPWHPRRFNDEILSSWILRIAAGNNVSVRSLCAWLGNDQPVAALDRMAYTSSFIDSVAESIGVEKEQVIECLPSSLHGLSRTPVYRSRGEPRPCRGICGKTGHTVLWVTSIAQLREIISKCISISQLVLVNPGKNLQRCAYCNRSVANCAPSERADKSTLRLCHACWAHWSGHPVVRVFLRCWQDFSTLCAVRLS